MERSARYPIHRRATSHSFGSSYLYPSPPTYPFLFPTSLSLDTTPRRSPRLSPLFLPLSLSIGDTATTYSLVPIPPTPSSPFPPSSSLSHLCSPLRCLFSLACVLALIPLYLLSAPSPPAASPLSIFPTSALIPVTYAINRTVVPLLPYPPTWQRPCPSPSPSSLLLFPLPSPLSPALSPPALTILTLLRPMTPSSLLTSPSVYHAQLLALTSYLALTPHVIAYADSPSTCRHLSPLLPRLTCRRLPSSCLPPPYRRPTLDCILGPPSPTPFTAYVNADVALHPLLLSHLRFLGSTFDRFAAVARRTDPSNPLAPLLSLNLSSLWSEAGAEGGSLHSDWGVDVFVLPSSPPLPLTFPPFLAGVYRWDNDLLAQLLSLRDVEVVDISSPGLALHLGGAAAGGAGGAGVGENHGTRKGAEWNERLSREAGNRWKVGRTANAAWALPCASTPHSPPSPASAASPEASRACELEWRGEGPEVQYLRAARDGWVVLFHVRDDGDLPVLFHFLCTMEAHLRGFLILSALPLPTHHGLAGRVVGPGRAVAAVVYDLLAYDYHVLYLTADALYLSFPSALGRSQGGQGSVHAPTPGCEALVVRAGPVSMRAFHAAVECEGETLCDCLQDASQGQEGDGEGFVLEEGLGSHRGVGSIVVRSADREAGELMSGWRWWAGEGLMANDNGGPQCLPDPFPPHPPPASLPFHFHVRAVAGESDAVLLLLESTSALTVDEGEAVHLTLEVDAPSPQLRSHLAAFHWPHGRLTVAAAGEQGEDGADEEAYHVVMTATHVVGERTMPLLRAFVSRWVQGDAGHPRLLGVTLSSNASTPVAAFSFHQQPSPHSYLLLPAGEAASLQPSVARIRAEGLLFVQPPSAWMALQHTQGAAERAEREEGQVEEWRLPRVDGMQGVDVGGCKVWSVWELRNRGRWPSA